MIYNTTLPKKVSKISRLDHVEAELPMLVNLHHLREERRITTGFHEAYGKLFDLDASLQILCLINFESITAIADTNLKNNCTIYLR
ncbi:MAG: hypothetical protein FWG84_01310 [Bacteroidales bacterium]|nr:hypothetical protein [Bacteroidales bacterium]